MNEVKAVKSKDTIQDITHLLSKHYSQREADVWVIGINLALRITDLLGLKYSDLTSGVLVLNEGKTGKKRRIMLNTTVVQCVNRRQRDHPTDVYLFQSTHSHGVAKPLSRVHVGSAFKEVGVMVGVQLGTHSMRKTRGYMMHQSGASLALICKVLNHSNIDTTLRYIGIEEEDIDNTYMSLNL